MTELHGWTLASLLLLVSGSAITFATTPPTAASLGEMIIALGSMCTVLAVLTLARQTVWKRPTIAAPTGQTVWGIACYSRINQTWFLVAEGPIFTAASEAFSYADERSTFARMYAPVKGARFADGQVKWDSSVRLRSEDGLEMEGTLEKLS